ncbi:hypothetical protein MFIFM68171_02981 [Madurella fahalii]|uniref:Uncharacterized protein n=1 Tax=Madurella fahalii TaxID=1157608 RepID=A0ABQ0G4T7_9PEZI
MLDALGKLDGSVEVTLSHSDVNSEGSNIRLVLDPGPKEWYDPGETQKLYFSINVDKDSRVLLRAEEQPVVVNKPKKRGATEMLAYPSVHNELKDNPSPRKQHMMEGGR